VSVPEIELGLAAQQEHVVSPDDTAIALGSGDVPVLATPRLLAWLEAVTVDAIAAALPAGGTSVGSRVEIEHSAASPIGTPVTVHAAVSHVDGRLVRFEVAAEMADGRLAASGTITRVVVDRARWLALL
jgi:fluoroacetyl-CoA thioesterase